MNAPHESVAWKLQQERQRIRRSITVEDIRDALIGEDMAEHIAELLRAPEPRDDESIGAALRTLIDARNERMAKDALTDLMDAPWRLPRIETARAGEEWS